MDYSISEAAEILGVTTSTLRYYEKEGIIPVADRTQGGIRRYSSENVEFMVVVETLKRTGMQIKDIKTFMSLVFKGNETIPQRREIILNQRDIIKKQIDSLKKTLDMLEYKLWFYETAEKAGTIAVPKYMDQEDVPENLREIRAEFVDMLQKANGKK